MCLLWYQVTDMEKDLMRSFYNSTALAQRGERMSAVIPLIPLLARMNLMPELFSGLVRSTLSC
jgi:hypothetical protein